jgi:hypothetical protein
MSVYLEEAKDDLTWDEGEYSSLCLESIICGAGHIYHDLSLMGTLQWQSRTARGTTL